MRAAFAAGFAVLFAAGTSAADVSWTAPAGCPSAAELRERIDRRLPQGGEVEVGAIAVSVTRTGKRLTATIDTARGQGRTLTASTCAELVDAVALVVARLAREAHEARVVDDPVVVVPAGEPEIEMPAEVVERTVARPAAWNGGLRALALSGIGMTPDVGLGADVALYVQRGSTFVELGYARWAPRPMYLLPGGIGQVDFGVQLVALRGGWTSEKMPLRGWAGVEIGEMEGEGQALRTQGPGRWVAISSGFGVGWPMSPRARLVGTFEVAVPIQRAEFSFMDGTEVREPAPISARSALGVELLWR